MRKLISIFVAVVMIVSAIPFTASANTYISGDFTYNIAGIAPNQTVTITGLSNPSFTGALTIPATIATPQGTLSVTMISNSAFWNRTRITSISIPSSIISIGSATFSGCTGLTTITVNTANTAYSSENGILFNKNKTAILKYPTAKTGTSYTVSNIVTSIGESAFEQCTNLTSITFAGGGNASTAIGNSAFRLCTNLSTVIFQAGSRVSYIGSNAFFECTSLTSIEIPDTVTTIDASAFIYCYNLTSAIIGTGVQHIGSAAFSYTSVTEVFFKSVIPPSFGTVPFVGNTILIVPFGAKAAYRTAYQAGFWLHNPNIVTEGCVHGVSPCPCYFTYDVMGVAPNQTITITGLISVDYAGDLVIPATINGLPVTRIGDDAFQNSLITLVDIPSSVEIIGNVAFAYCRYLTTLKFNREYPPVFALLENTWGVFFMTDERVLTIYVPNNNAIAMYKAVLQANDFNIRGIDFKTIQ